MLWWTLRQLRSKTSETRQRAARQLGESREPRALKPVVEALKDSDSDVRKAAAEALVKIGAPAVEPLIAALKDSNWMVPKAAAEALGQIGDARAVEPLIAALKDSDWWLRRAAAEALKQIGDARAVEPLIAALKDSDSGVRRPAAEALDKMGWRPGQDESGPAYWIAKGEWDECIKIGAPAVEPLIAALKDSDSDVRRAAAETLGKIADAQAVEPLAVALSDKDEDVQRAAIEALGWIGDARAMEPLLVAVLDERSSMRDAATTALVKIGAGSLETLVGALNSKEWFVRLGAAQTLDQTNPKWRESAPARAAVPSLVAALEEEDAEVRQAAIHALQTIGGPVAQEALDHFNRKAV